MTQTVKYNNNSFQHIEAEGDKTGFFPLASQDISGPNIPASLGPDIFFIEKVTNQESEGNGTQ